ncbi:hypothetical protein M9458_038750, partial [Cirrhinus mrigala]
MNHPACLLLMLEQRSLSLRGHTRLFVEIANFTHYPDYCLCTFYKTSPTQDPKPSQTSPDSEAVSSATDEPSPSRATVPRIATEPEPIPSDQVREPAPVPMTVDVKVEHEGAMESPTHCTPGDKKVYVEQDLIDFYGDVSEDMPHLLPPSSELPVCPELPVCLEQSVCLELSNYLNFPPALPLLPPPISPAASALPPL